MYFLGVVASQAIRGVLGLETEELPDEVFIGTGFEAELRIGIEEWLPETVSEVCSQTGASVAGYPEKMELLQLYAQYSGALVMFPHVRFGVAMSTEDGQNAFKRDPKAAAKLLPELKARAGRYKDLLLTAYSEDTASSDSLPFFGSAAPNYDPVTDTSET